MTIAKENLFILVLSAIIVCNSPLSAQSIQWSRTFGGPGDERAYDVQQTLDGGYVVGGVSPGGFYASS
jgi:hypothetical protein